MSLSIYIPRILGSVSRKTVYDAFNHMGIGTVTELDMIYKINENRNAYYFAFIKITPYDTPQYSALQRDLEQNRYIRLAYDEEAGQYWEIKNYIPRTHRAVPPSLQLNDARPPQPEYSLWGLPYSIWTPVEHIIESITSAFQPSASIWTPIAPIIESITSAFQPTASIFTAQDRQDLVKEYEELEKQIYVQVSSV